MPGSESAAVARHRVAKLDCHVRVGIGGRKGHEILFGRPVPRSTARPLTRSGCESNAASWGNSISMRCQAVRTRYDASTDRAGRSDDHSHQGQFDAAPLDLLEPYRVAVTAIAGSSRGSKALAADGTGLIRSCCGSIGRSDFGSPVGCTSIVSDSTSAICPHARSTPRGFR